MIFTFDISAIIILLLCIALLAALASIFCSLRPLWAVTRRGRHTETPSEGETPGISVIVYTLNAEDKIRQLTASLLAQEGVEMEVILVADEASWDNTKTVVNNLADGDDRVRATYVPASARNISRRKTAFTLGLKAARYPVALLTEADVEVPSAQWVRMMAAPFASQYIDIVIGADYVPRGIDRGAGRWWRSFFTVTETAQWLGSALLGCPYRGTAHNLGVRVATFFQHKGFASSTTLVGGEDDIFVNEVAREGNTAIVFNPEAMPAVEVPSEEYPRLWLRRRERYMFTQRHLKAREPQMQGLGSFTLWTDLLCAVAAALLPLTQIGEPFNIMPTCAAAVIMLGIWACQIMAERGAAHALQSPRLFWYVPVLYLLRPVANMFYRMAFRRTRTSNYVWHDTPAGRQHR